jgi:hypothetical protein
MRECREEFLPRHDKEDLRKYTRRLSRAVLKPAYRDAIELAVSRPFSRPVAYDGDLPPELEDFWARVDRQGLDMTTLTRRWFTYGLRHGMCHVLADAPAGKAANLKEERELGIRPRAVLIKAPELTGWRWRIDPVRGLVLTQIRFEESVSKPDDGEYGESEVTRFRVITNDPSPPEGSDPEKNGVWQVFEKEAGGKLQLVDEGPFEHPDGIPLVTFYAMQQGPLLAEPPFQHLAFLNIAHYQSTSEQRDLLAFARVGVWFAKGWSREELDRGLTIGAHRFVGSENPNASLEVVEHGGSALDAGRQDIMDLEAQMRETAHDVITSAPTGDVRATTSVMGERRQESQIGAWIQEMNAAIRQLVVFAGRWRDGAPEVPENFQPQVFADFVVGLRGDADVGQLHQMRSNRDLSRQTYYEELQRRGFLSDSVTVEQEEERLAAEAMDVPMFSRPQEPQEDRFGAGVPDPDPSQNGSPAPGTDRSTGAAERTSATLPLE